MANYKTNGANSDGDTKLRVTEFNLYGSSRLGIIKKLESISEANTAPIPLPTMVSTRPDYYAFNDAVPPTLVPQTSAFAKAFGVNTKGNITYTYGNINYELSNHLGNVLTVISDRKLPIDNAGAVGYFTADILRTQDYYAFGSTMPGRSFGTEDYKFGFNGKENDAETSTQDYGFRIYNPSLGKFLSVDPIAAEYPWYSPYHFAGNTPIRAIDLDGLEPTLPKNIGSDPWANPYVKGRQGRLILVTAGFIGSGGALRYFNGTNTTRYLGYLAPKVDHSKFIQNSGNAPDRQVNENTQFILTNENAYEGEYDLVNNLTGNFIYGIGPENIVFPHNGKAAGYLKNSNLVKEGLEKWYKGNGVEIKDHYNFDAVDHLTGALDLEMYVGSANYRITDLGNGMGRFEIFNPTSAASGDIVKEVPYTGDPIKGLKRDPDKRWKNIQYTNTSQYFSFDFKIDKDKLGK